ncbi:MAG: hypothetical protein ACOC35_13965 [Promethearchaeia archaeon]
MSFVDSKNEDFGAVFATSLIIVIVFAILSLFIGSWLLLIVALILMWVILSARHTYSFGSAILVSIIAVILFIIVVWLLNFVLNITIVTLPF